MSMIEYIHETPAGEVVQDALAVQALFGIIMPQTLGESTIRTAYMAAYIDVLEWGVCPCYGRFKDELAVCTGEETEH